MLSLGLSLTGARLASPLVALFDASAGALPAWLSFSRATTGTFIGSNGLTQTAAINTPRIDFTGGSPGLLIEEARTNLAPQSQNFADASWQVFAGAAKVAAGASDPSSGTSAHEISVGATGGAISAASALYRTHTFAAGAHTFSVWLRSKTGTTTVRLAVSDGAAVVTGTVDLSLTTSWARYVITVTTAAGFGNISIRNNVAGNSANIFVAFAQLEAGSFPTSYIPTAGSAVTRSADIAQITGAALAALRGPSASVVAEILAGAQGSSSPRIIGTNGAGAPTPLNITGVDRAAAWDATSEIMTAANNSMVTNTIRVGAAWQNSVSRSIVKDGGSVVSGVLAYSFATPTIFYLGSAASTNHINGRVSKLAIYNTRLPDAQLQARTIPGAGL